MGIRTNIRKIKRDNSLSKNIESQLSMYLYEKHHSPITTKFSGYGLSECDVISISKSNYIYEYEIKISRSDFKADFNKEKHKLMLEKRCFVIDETDDILYLTSNYFYFVVPEKLISIDEIPEYSGLIYFTDGIFKIIKKAPMIHKTKASSNFIRKLSHNLTCKLIFNKIK